MKFTYACNNFENFNIFTFVTSFKLGPTSTTLTFCPKAKQF